MIHIHPRQKDENVNNHRALYVYRRVDIAVNLLTLSLQCWVKMLNFLVLLCIIVRPKKKTKGGSNVELPCFNIYNS